MGRKSGAAIPVGGIRVTPLDTALCSQQSRGSRTIRENALSTASPTRQSLLSNSRQIVHLKRRAGFAHMADWQQAASGHFGRAFPTAQL
jgi:hypothetical protein